MLVAAINFLALTAGQAQQIRNFALPLKILWRLAAALAPQQLYGPNPFSLRWQQGLYGQPDKRPSFCTSSRKASIQGIYYSRTDTPRASSQQHLGQAVEDHSRMPSAEKSLEKKRDEVRRSIESRLRASGEQDKIRRHIRIALNTCGWIDDVKSLCQDMIRQKGVENCAVEEIVEAILPQVRDRVPKQLKQEVLDMLWEFADTHEIGISDDDDLLDATS